MTTPSSQPNNEEETTVVNVKKSAASLSDTLSFLFRCGVSTQLLFVGGTVGGMAHGMTWPLLAYFMSQTFQTLSGLSGPDALLILEQQQEEAVTSSSPLAQIREISVTFILLGVYSLVTAFFQNFCFQLAAARASRLLQYEWFHALLRKDMSFWDTHPHVNGMATSMMVAAASYRRGMGAKFGETIQNITTGLAGILFGLVASWQVALLIFCILPFVTAATFRGMQLNRTKSMRAADYYQQAGSIAMTTLTSLRTVLSLNAVPARLQSYQHATQSALDSAKSFMVALGFWNAAMMAAVISLFALVVLFGSYVMYRDVRVTGCDPGGSFGTGPCPTTGADIFGAMIGIMFSMQALSRLGNCLEAFQEARVAVGEAMSVIQDDDDDDAESKKAKQTSLPKAPETNTDQQMTLVEEGTHQSSKQQSVPYDPFSNTAGIKPKGIQGNISFSNISFSYPSRPDDIILKNFSIDIPAGKTVALVGPSGGGKSTVLGLIERYYSPCEGEILLDGTNIQHLNLKAYRQTIGYVSQEPVLFAASIRDNIAHGSSSTKDDITQEEIEQAAKLANAHNFITSFPEGYDTHVGHKGAQLSGGEKQRVAMARVLVSNPNVLLLDEATSALDSQSEQVVQAALDRIVEEQARTTIIVAHRLSTIRNADIIFVIADGQVAEQGTHAELMTNEAGHYRHLVETQEGPTETAPADVATDAPVVQRDSSIVSVDNDDEPKGQGSFLLGTPETCAPPPLLAPKDDGEQIPAVRFRNVCFSYPARPTKTVFQNFNLDLLPGETVALVGPSGGGKSTTVALLERFYDPSGGVVEYKGHDITSLNVHWYRDQIGYVGQEPTLFPGSIAENIAFGAPNNSSREAIEEAAKQANAHNFIMSFPQGYDTQVGELGTQVSGGQKQRIAIARALIKKPPLLILDEATSALDNESEKIVQEALSQLMRSRNQTTLVIAHKLSTVRDADRIAFISGGAVLEIGSHDELMAKKNGHYQGLVNAQKRVATIEESIREELDGSKTSVQEDAEEEEEDSDDDLYKSTLFSEKEDLKEEKDSVFSVDRIKQLAAPNTRYILVGSLGALLGGCTYPLLGMLFAGTIDVFFFTVRPCPNTFAAAFNATMGFDSCEEYWDSAADTMQSQSFDVAIYYCLLTLLCFVGGILSFWGFGQASERLTKSVRDDTFASLVRLPPAYHDTHDVGTLLSALGEDTARLHAFAGTPFRQLIEAAASVVLGLIVSFAFMWPFALMTIVVFVPLSVAARLTRAQQQGDEGVRKVDSDSDPSNPGSILSETLSNIRTIAALTLEAKKFDAFNKSVLDGDHDVVPASAVIAFKAGLGMCLQRFSNALMYWWGGYLLINYPEQFEFRDFIIAQFTFILGVIGLGAALADLDSRDDVRKCAIRVFKILDRESPIDPLSEEGKKLDQEASSMPIDPVTEELKKNLDYYDPSDSSYSQEVSV
ncbi:Leptomycin B resistance protein pmd1 [Seminavis robusta]|uniref:Leptomycin B resistance protein pmd1 n=1 Tax=Seminavis robusta TaxID=568900 RepID=A0A9N8DMQ4_9STRA|nr:Leptomycin B resistance protein pmd1 [Seminavis robusta]|eukprot:Sro232_g093950.1 Leptomycin B resistance protein pmd1 (1449) ;mRNA; r:54834-59653